MTAREWAILQAMEDRLLTQGYTRVVDKSGVVSIFRPDGTLAIKAAPPARQQES